ncbi:hypothetical protein Pmar_PMAR020593, partial [Perkinsus marinus ATCC 50983]
FLPWQSIITTSTQKDEPKKPSRRAFADSVRGKCAFKTPERAARYERRNNLHIAAVTK